MRIFAIGDLHLSGEPPRKPMDIFGDHWKNHWPRIKESWQRQAASDDLILLVGDISWALKFTEALEDLDAIAALPGQKYMIRGNHDYWWSSVSKMNRLAGGITFLQGHGTAVTDPSSGLPVAFGGTRGYLCPGDSLFNPESDTSIYERELLRTEAALKEMQAYEAATTILLLHYPPFSDQGTPSGFTELLAKYKVSHCIFGHLHDELSFSRIPEYSGTTRLHLVSADYLTFALKEIIL